MPSYRIEEIAGIVGGEVVGDGSIEIRGVAGLKEAVPGEITFLANPKYEAYLASTIAAGGNGSFDGAIIKIDNPYLAFLKVVRLFAETPLEKYSRGVHATAIIPGSVKLGEEISIGAYVVLEENVSIGDRTTILPLACIND